MAKILIVDDEPNIVKIMAAVLQQAGHETHGAGNGEDALVLYGLNTFDLVITDMRLGAGMDGMTLLHELLVRQAGVPVIMITAYGTIELAVEAMKQGASDFLRKPFKMEELLATVDNVISGRKIAAAHVSPRDQGSPPMPELHFGLLIGETPEMQRLYGLIERVSPSDATALISGESGTGKELAAKAIHQFSRRRAGPWIPLNCAALPAALLESEMFGHAAGAFTGAVNRKDGLFMAAHQGTLFLDEIGAMDIQIQSKLLRVLQERKVRRVGETDDCAVDVRVIAATNEALEEKKDRGEFREDLFYRINVIPVEMPPLRRRLADIPLFLTYFCEQQSKLLNCAVHCEPSVLDALMTYSWPGNVRELANAVACAAVLCQDGCIKITDLPPRISRRLTRRGTLPAAPQDQVPLSLRDFLREKEREYMEQILQFTGGNRGRAADLLGISRATFYRKYPEAGAVVDATLME